MLHNGYYDISSIIIFTGKHILGFPSLLISVYKWQVFVLAAGKMAAEGSFGYFT